MDGRLGSRFLSDFYMRATGSLSGHWVHALAINIKPILLSMRCPSLFKSVYWLGAADTESEDRQNHCANTDMMLSTLANTPALRTPKQGGTDTSLGSKPLKHRIQVIR